MDKPVQTDVTLGNDIKVIVLSKGTIDIMTKQGEHKVMPDVFYLAGLKPNLMSTLENWCIKAIKCTWKI